MSLKPAFVNIMKGSFITYREQLFHPFHKLWFAFRWFRRQFARDKSKTLFQEFFMAIEPLKMVTALLLKLGVNCFAALQIHTTHLARPPAPELRPWDSAHILPRSATGT